MYKIHPIIPFFSAVTNALSPPGSESQSSMLRFMDFDTSVVLKVSLVVTPVMICSSKKHKTLTAVGSVKVYLTLKGAIIWKELTRVLQQIFVRYTCSVLYLVKPELQSLSVVFREGKLRSVALKVLHLASEEL